MVLVTKSDGSRAGFDRGKVLRTCLRLNVPQDAAEKIADRVEGRLYEGVPTKKILQMIFAYTRKYRPEIKHRIDLRHAISLMRSKPDFEEFVRFVLREHGYEVRPNEIIPGRCVEHEIDAIAEKDGAVFYVEVKHHVDYHSFTGLRVFLEAMSTFQDLVDGNKAGKNGYAFNRPLVVCNTKISEHARKYAECRGISHIGWNYPEGASLSEMIDSRRLYPVTILKGLDSYTQGRLGDNMIVSLKQLAEAGAERLAKIGISKDKSAELVHKAKALLGAS